MLNRIILYMLVVYTGTFAYQVDQSLLESHYFGIYENGSVFVKESLLTFITGSTFIVIAKDVANATGKFILNTRGLLRITYFCKM